MAKIRYPLEIEYGASSKNDETIDISHIKSLDIYSEALLTMLKDYVLSNKKVSEEVGDRKIKKVVIRPRKSIEIVVEK